jgi:hypothetical protein
MFTREKSHCVAIPVLAVMLNATVALAADPGKNGRIAVRGGVKIDQ